MANNSANFISPQITIADVPKFVILLVFILYTLITLCKHFTYIACSFSRFENTETIQKTKTLEFLVSNVLFVSIMLGLHLKVLNTIPYLIQNFIFWSIIIDLVAHFIIFGIIKPDIRTKHVLAYEIYMLLLKLCTSRALFLYNSVWLYIPMTYFIAYVLYCVFFAHKIEL